MNKRKCTTPRKSVNQSPSAELVERDWLVSHRATSEPCATCFAFSF